MTRTLTILALAGSLLLGGCGGSGTGKGPLRVGVLNTARIVEEDPAYKELQLNIMGEKSSLVSALPSNPEDLSKDQWDKVRADGNKKQAEWQKQVMEFINKSVKKITAVTAEVAKQRDLDIVVINTPFTNAVHYTSGQDITLDVLLKLSHSK